MRSPRRWAAAGQIALATCAALAASFRKRESAARLHGAAESQAEASAYHPEPTFEQILAPLIARTREALGTPAFAVAKAAGRALSYEDAMAQARAWLDYRS